MFYHLYIKPSWIASPSARKFYSMCALLAIFCWLGVLIPTNVAVKLAGHTLYEFPLLALTLRTVMFIGVLGAATVWIAMWYFWVQYHDGNTVSKALWFVVFVLLGPVAALIYFAFVYRRSPLVATPKQQPVTA